MKKAFSFFIFSLMFFISSAQDEDENTYLQPLSFLDKSGLSIKLISLRTNFFENSQPGGSYSESYSNSINKRTLCISTSFHYDISSKFSLEGGVSLFKFKHQVAYFEFQQSNSNALLHSSPDMEIQALQSSLGVYFKLLQAKKSTFSLGTGYALTCSLNIKNKFQTETRNFSDKPIESIYFGIRYSRHLKTHFHLIADAHTAFGLTDLNRSENIESIPNFGSISLGIGYRFLSCN